MFNETHDRDLPKKVEEYSRPIVLNAQFEFQVRLWLGSEGVRGQDRDNFIAELAEEIPLNDSGTLAPLEVIEFLERKLDGGY